MGVDANDDKNDTNIEKNDEANLDEVLTEVGEFGLFHVVTYILISFPCLISAGAWVNYMMMATTLDYRCKIPECDIGVNNREIPFDQPWLRDAIPYPLNKMDKCQRYVARNGTTNADGQCGADLFDNTKLIECSEFIYSSDEKNVQTEFNIHCSDTYKLALIGTVGSIGRFIFLPITGVLADKFGRMKMVVSGMMVCNTIGLFKSFAQNYYVYLVCELLEACVGSAFAGSFVLALEIVTTRYRVLGGTLISLSFPIGEIIFGVVAMYVHDFRHLLRITYIPGLLIFINYFLVPESIRWLLVTGRVDRAVKILKRIARTNGKVLSEKSIDSLKSKYSIEMKSKDVEAENNKEVDKPQSESFIMIFKSKTLFIRFLICSYQWVAACFYYYGISLHATHIPGANRYVSFLIIVSVELPIILISLPLMNRFSRRSLMFWTLLMAAISIAATAFVSEEHSTVNMILSLFGKSGISIAFQVLYIFTAEQWPTNLRTTIMNSCSMIGRIGSMVAPFAVVLGSQFGSLPALLFGGSALIAAVLVLFDPETNMKKLPDTISEAKQL